jgi:hypothetical protein
MLLLIWVWISLLSSGSGSWSMIYWICFLDSYPIILSINGYRWSWLKVGLAFYSFKIGKGSYEEMNTKAVRFSAREDWV